MEMGEVQIWVKDCKNLPPVRGVTIDPFVKWYSVAAFWGFGLNFATFGCDCFPPQHRPSRRQQENPTEDTGGEEDSQPHVQSHHGV